MTNPDIIVIGAGHNGLVAATYLAKAGRKVLVLERRAEAGGQLAPIAYGKDFDVDPLHAGGRLRADIVRDLGLAQHGLHSADGGPAPACIAPLPDGGLLRLSADARDAATLDSIRRLSERDAARWPEFVQFMSTAASFLDVAQGTPMPRLTNAAMIEQGRPLAALAWRLRRLGSKDMFRFMRSLSMSAVEFTEEWFESEPIKAALGALAVHGSTLGSMSAGTGYTLIHNWLNRGGPAHRAVAGGSRQIAASLAAAFRAAGGDTAHAVSGRTDTGRPTAGARRATGERRGNPRTDRRLGRRPAPHAPRSRGRPGTAAGVRVAGAVDQDARLGREGARAHGWRPRLAARHDRHVHRR